MQRMQSLKDEKERVKKCILLRVFLSSHLLEGVLGKYFVICKRKAENSRVQAAL